MIKAFKYQWHDLVPAYLEFKTQSFHHDVSVRLKMSLVQLSQVPAIRRNNSRQDVHTLVPQSPNSIIWYWPKYSDAMWLELR